MALGQFSIYNERMSSHAGLTREQASERLARYGPNDLPVKRGKGRWGILVDQFKSPLVLLLGAAALVAGVVGDVVDSGLIVAIVVVNAILGWVQEYKADEAVKKLKKLGGGRVRVMRSGREEEVGTSEIVPGDRVYLEEGTRIPADGRMVSTVELEVDEAVLTGESLPVVKKAGRASEEVVFSGTLVARGYGWMEVSATGGATRFGQLAYSLSTVVKEESPLAIKLDRLARLMVICGAVACAAVVGLVVVEGGGWLAAWSGGVSLAVAVIPEGLPTVLSVTLAVGVSKMARRRAVVRKMAAVEALGGATVVACDKTGTLTKNEMEVRQVEVSGKLLPPGQRPGISDGDFRQMLLAGVLASTAIMGEGGIIGDQTEGALLKLSHGAGLDPKAVGFGYAKVTEYPFDGRTRLMSTVVETGDEGEVVYVKGAPEAVWERCKWMMDNGQLTMLDKERRERIREHHDEMAKSGLRVLGLAYKKLEKGVARVERAGVEKDLVYLGMAGIADPLRAETPEVLAAAQAAGVRVIIVTGDSELTAHRIARDAGLVGEGEEEVLTGEELAKISDEALVNQIRQIRVYARVSPEQKLRIVRVWQSLGEIVVMAGDGVNDALALKQADVGVAMGKTGTDVARETADVVLLDDNLRTILKAIESGRNIVLNISQSVKFLLACNLGEVVAILGAAALTSQSPLSPAQILWVNLVTDSLPALALAVDSGRPNLMIGRARGVGRWLVGRAELGWMIGAAAVVGFTSLGAWLAWGRVGMFTAIVEVQMLVALAVRGFRRPNGYLVGAIALVLVLQTVILTVPGLRGMFKI